MSSINSTHKMHWEKTRRDSEGQSASTGALTPLIWPGGSRTNTNPAELRRTQLILSSATKGIEKLAKGRITTINPTRNFNYGCPDLTPIIYRSWMCSSNKRLIFKIRSLFVQLRECSLYVLAIYVLCWNVSE